MEVKGEQGGGGGGEVEETCRDKSERIKKEEEAKLLHNNMGDLTLLHCSNSC